MKRDSELRAVSVADGPYLVAEVCMRVIVGEERI
jgi:hypothetical protein